MRYLVPSWLLVAVLLAGCSGDGQSSASLEVSAPRPAEIRLGPDQALEADVAADEGRARRSAAFSLGGGNSVISAQLVGIRPGTRPVTVSYSVDDPRFGAVVVASIQRSLELDAGPQDVDFTREPLDYLRDDDGVTRLQKLYVGVDPGRPLAHFLGVSAGLAHTCAIRDDGTLWCWGSNHEGQLGQDAGLGADDAHAVPQAIEGSWSQVSAGDYHTCAIRDDATLWCWGDDGHGQLGRAEGGPASPEAGQVGEAADWTQVSAGGDHSCGIRADRTLWCWGANGAGQLGVAPAGDVVEPVQVEADAVTAWLAVSAGGSHTCALSASRGLWCWGSNLYGQLGKAANVGAGDPNAQPSAVLGAWRQVSARAFHGCAIRTDGTLWCWGNNRYGQLGRTDNIGGDAPNAVPLQLGDPRLVWRSVSAGQLHGCALTEGGELWCWGGGVGSVDRLADPDARLFVPPPDDAGWIAVSAGGTHACAIRASGTLWCWGGNDAGQLGNGLPLGVLPAPVAMSAPD
jgi:alpha-tubulin suppressor-like RCC1 family protein